MKKQIATLLIIIFAGIIYAQDSEPVKKLKKSDRTSIEIYNDIWFDTPGHIDFKGFQPGFRYNSFKDHPIGTSNFSFAYGAGFSFSNIHSNGLVSHDSTGNTIFTKLPEKIGTNDLKYSTNKLTLGYIETPLEIRFRTKSRNPFKIYGGFKLAYMVQHYTKYVGDDFIEGSTYDIKYKEYKQRNMNKLQYGPTFRIGYKSFLLSAQYNMNPIFKTDKGPQMYPISIGISYSPI